MYESELLLKVEIRRNLIKLLLGSHQGKIMHEMAVP